MEKFKSIELKQIVEKEKESPIKPGEVFDPEKELAKIKKTGDRQKRKKALEEYKEKLAYQKEGLAQMQEDIIKLLRANPDVPLEDVGILIDGYVKKHGLTIGQQLKISAVLEAYSRKHSIVHGLRRLYTDDAKLFNLVFGQPPKGRVEIIEGPMTLYFRCHNVEDYALISQRKFLEREVPKRAVTGEDIEAASLEGGVSIAEALIPGLEGAIIAEKAEGHKFDEKRSQEIHIHEEQHALKRLFQKPPHRQRRDLDRVERLLESENPVEKIAGLQAFFRNWRAFSEERAKDELLAYLKQGVEASEILIELTKTKHAGGLYDYFSERKKQQIEELAKKYGEKWRSLISETADRVYFFDYLKLLDDGITAYQALRDSGFSGVKAIALLIGERLVDWKKVVARQLKKSYNQ